MVLYCDQLCVSEGSLPDDVSNDGATEVGISNANCTRRANAVNSDFEL